MHMTGQKSILLVEDEPLIAMAEAKAIESFGYKVVIAYSGEKAVELASEEISLILMDINLGRGIDGPEAAGRILKHRNIPIVFLTSHSEESYVERVKEITRYGYVIKNSGTFVLKTSIETAFELFEAHEIARERESALAKNLSLLNEMGKMAKIGGWEFDVEKKELHWTKECYSLYELDSTFVPTVEKILEFYTPSSRLQLVKAIQDVMDSVSSYDLESEIITAKGNRRWVRSLGRAVLDKGKITHRVGVTHDISERKQSEGLLQNNEDKFHTLFEAESDAVFLIDNESGQIHEVNSSAVGMYGYSREELLSKRNVDLSAEPDSTREAMLNRKNLIPVRWHKKKDGTVFPVEISASHLVWNGRPFHIAAIRDISFRKEAEDRIVTLLAEKDLLLKEVHHRIKNNMNTMMSLLSLQANEMKDASAATALKDAQNRFHSMGVLYDKLYHTENLREMSVRAYLPSLVDEIAAMFSNVSNVKIENEIEDFVLDVRELSTLGIIVNELVTNAMKHAFAGNDKGSVRVSAAKTGNQAVVVVEDDGIGIPETSGGGHPNGFGLMLVGSLIKQLNGSMRIERKTGTRFVLEFEVPSPAGEK